LVKDGWGMMAKLGFLHGLHVDVDAHLSSVWEERESCGGLGGSDG